MFLRVKEGRVVHAGRLRFLAGETIPMNALTKSSAENLVNSGDVELVEDFLDEIAKENEIDYDPVLVSMRDEPS